MKKYIIAMLISSLILTSMASASNGDILAGSGIIVKQDTEAGYRLNDYILRQEVVGMAVKINGEVLPANYSCKGYYSDLTGTRPNNWACRAVEIAADSGLVTRSNTLFRPEDRVTKAEALAMLMNAAKVNTGATIDVTSFTDVTIPWQVNITAKALDKNIIDWGSTFLPNKDATRGEVFDMAARIIQPIPQANPLEGDIDFEDLLQLLEE